MILPQGLESVIRKTFCYEVKVDGYSVLKRQLRGLDGLERKIDSVDTHAGGEEKIIFCPGW
jgi:hypothetical protein